MKVVILGTAHGKNVGGKRTPTIRWKSIVTVER